MAGGTWSEGCEDYFVDTKNNTFFSFLRLLSSKMPMGIILIPQGFFSEPQGLNLGFGYWGSILLVRLCS